FLHSSAFSTSPQSGQVKRIGSRRIGFTASPLGQCCSFHSTTLLRLTARATLAIALPAPVKAYASRNGMESKSLNETGHCSASYLGRVRRTRMNWGLCIALALAALGVPNGTKEQLAERELEKLTGTWIGVSRTSKNGTVVYRPGCHLLLMIGPHS